MAAFFRGLLLFLFGALAGAAGILFLTPSFQVDVRRGDTAIKPLDLGTRVAQPTPSPAPDAVPAAPSKVAAPAPTAVATGKPAPSSPAPATVSPATSASPAPAAADPALDFAAIARHLVLWPTAVAVKKATTVAVPVEGQKPQDLALEAGTVLQLTRVLPNGQLEVRAKGAKFEIASTLTDFAAELGKRVTELVAKGTKFDSPYPTVVTPAPAPAPAVAVAATPPAPAVAVAPKRPPTLAERIDVLYGRKPVEPVAPTPAAAAPAVPVPAPAPAAVAPSPAPAVDAAVAPAPTAPPAPASREAAKVEEKGKDLDRKMNQLFK
ncbi:MAG: hypothetical protein FJ384_00215 [Verrucomicrobia bacterium]|nr:hypothetical protein [Verrucomicrobiota bacterium]